MKPSDERTPLNVGQAEFAGWLALLDPTSTASAEMKAKALAKVAEAYMTSQLNESHLADALEVAHRENGELREYRRKVAALTVESKVEGAVVIAAEVGMVDRLLTRMRAELPAPTPGPLRLVRTGRCPGCDAAIGDRHSLSCSVDIAQLIGRPEGA